MAVSPRSPLSPELQASLREAMAAFNAGQLDAAERNCQRVLAKVPGNLRALGVYGAVLHAQERYADAEGVFSELVKADPNVALYWMNLGTAQRGAGKFEE